MESIIPSNEYSLEFCSPPASRHIHLFQELIARNKESRKGETAEGCSKGLRRLLESMSSCFATVVTKRPNNTGKFLRNF